MAPQTRSTSKEAETISVQDKVPGAGRGIGRRLAASGLLVQLGALPGLGMTDQTTMRGLQVPLARQRGGAPTRRQPPPPPTPPAPPLPRRLPPRLTHRLQVCEARLPRAVQPWAEDGADAAGGHGPGEPRGAAGALSPGREQGDGRVDLCRMPLVPPANLRYAASYSKHAVRAGEQLRLAAQPLLNEAEHLWCLVTASLPARVP